MDKKITIDYQEWLDTQEEIKKLKEANSALCQGAPVLEVNQFNYELTMYPMASRGYIRGRISDSMDLINVAERFVAKGAESGVRFDGVECLISELEQKIKVVKGIINEDAKSKAKLEKIIKKLRDRNLWQRILNKGVVDYESR